MTVVPTPAHRRHARPTWLAFLMLGVLLGAGGVLVFTLDESSDTAGGSGVPGRQARAVPAFSSVQLVGSNIVTVRVGGARSVIVRGDDNLLSHITTTVRSGRLVIGTTGSFSTRTPMRVAVTVPSLVALGLGGSGIISAQGVHARSLRVTLSGSGVLRASGTADRLDVRLGGSGVAQLRDLVARDTHAVITGSGRIDVTATKGLDASIPGTGAIVYGGGPERVTTSVSGTGAITRR